MKTRTRWLHNTQKTLDILLQSENDEYDSLAGNTSSEDSDSWSNSDVKNDEISNQPGIYSLHFFTSFCVGCI